MLTVKQLFIADGLGFSENEIKLVRHVDHSQRSIRRVVAEGHFERYQREQLQEQQPFHHCKVILSFIGLEDHKAEFYGAYRVNGVRAFQKSDWVGIPDYLWIAHNDQQPRIYYDLEEISSHQNYRGRLVVHWSSPRRWYQSKDLDIYEILPATISTLFPGYQELCLGFEGLKAIFADPRAHRDWQAALQANAGIYRIVDLSDGGIYIGSAYGDGGLWARWHTYARNGHGGNKLLKDRYPSNFRWSVVRTLSTTMSPRDVIRIEGIEKEKHGSRAIGLNGN
ncbi:MAG: GIY-YIG nuclease family protein [Opitutales bacterium]